MEPVLAAELASNRIGALDVTEGHLGVSFNGPPEVGARAVLWSRSALRVMELLGCEDEVHTPDHLYDFSRQAVPWDALLDDRSSTISVQSVLSAQRAQQSGRSRPGDWHCGECGSLVFASKEECFKCGAPKPYGMGPSGVPEALTHTHFSSLTVKNAVCDVMRESRGWRPSVDTEDADLPLFLHVHRGRASLYRLLSGGGSMHKRGYRTGAVHVAALRETLAAGMLLRAGYDAQNDVLCDPMTGSGTIAIEAALIGTNSAPGLLRSPPALTRWPDIDPRVWLDAAEEARDVRTRRAPQPIYANDVHGGALELARRAAAAAGVEDSIEFCLGPAATFTPPTTPSLVVTNPPWGERLEGGEEAWEELRHFLKGQCGGARAWVLSGNKELTQHLRMRAAERVRIENAGASLALLAYDVLKPKPPTSASAFDGDDGQVEEEEADDVEERGPSEVVTQPPSRPPPLQRSPPPVEDTAEEVSATAEEEVSRMKVAELKAALGERGLKVSGLKAELAERLLDAIASGNEGAAPAPAPARAAKAPSPPVKPGVIKVADGTAEGGDDDLEAIFSNLYG